MFLRRFFLYFVILSLVVFSASFQGCAVFKSGTDEKKGKEIMSEQARERINDAEKRRGEHYAKRLEHFIRQTPTLEKGGVVFIGDSITEGMPLEIAFPEKNVINRGIGGDRISGVTERLDVSAEKLEPETVYLMIGINDILWDNGNTNEQLGKEYDELLKQLRKCAPQARIYVQSILPVTGNFSEHNPRVEEMNDIIEDLAKSHKLEWVDLRPALSDENGELKSRYTMDGVHLMLEGYLAWFKEILGPDEYFDVLINLMPEWKEFHIPVWPVDKIDPPKQGRYPGSRGPDEMVIYTPAYGHPSTGTNEWGREAVIVNDVVQSVGGNDREIPENGYVISGHGRSNSWITMNLRPGLSVRYGDKEIRVGAQPFQKIPPSQRIISLRRQLYHVISSVERDKVSSFREEIKEIVKDIDELEQRDEEITEKEFMDFSLRIRRLEARSVSAPVNYIRRSKK